LFYTHVNALKYTTEKINTEIISSSSTEGNKISQSKELHAKLSFNRFRTSKGLSLKDVRSDGEELSTANILKTEGFFI